MVSQRARVRRTRFIEDTLARMEVLAEALEEDATLLTQEQRLVLSNGMNALSLALNRSKQKGSDG